MNKPKNKAQILFHNVLQKKKNFREVKNLLWLLGQKLFEKEKMQSLRTEEAVSDITQLVAGELLRFYSENGIHKISGDFTNDLLGMHTKNRKLKRELKERYNQIVQLATVDLVQFVTVKKDNVFKTKDFQLIQKKFSEMVRHYAEKRSAQDVIDISEMKSQCLVVWELCEQEDQVIFKDVERLVDSIADKGVERKQDSEQGVVEWVSQHCELVKAGNTPAEFSHGMKTELIKLHDLTQEITFYQERLQKQVEIEKDPKIKWMIKKSLEDSQLRFESKFLMNNEVSLEILKSLKNHILGRFEKLADRLSVLDKYKKGLMTFEEEKHLLESVENVIEAELQEMYQNPLNPLNPGAHGFSVKKSTDVPDPEDLELDQILENKQVENNRQTQVWDMLLRNDILVRSRVVVPNKKQYLLELEKWKQGMRVKGLGKLVPEFDYDPIVFEAPKQSRVSQRRVFNHLDFSNQDPWQTAEATGISPESSSLQLRVDKTSRRHLLREVLYSSLEEMIYGDELNVFALLFDLLDKLANPNSNPKSKSGSVNVIVKALIEKSLKQVDLPASAVDKAAVKSVEKQVTDFVMLYEDLLHKYINSRSNWGKSLLSKQRKVYLMIQSFEKNLTSGTEGEYMGGMISLLKAHFKFDDLVETLKLDRDQEGRATNHSKYFLEFLDSQMAVKGNTLERVEYHLDQNNLANQEQLQAHFEEVFNATGDKLKIRMQRDSGQELEALSRQLPPGFVPVTGSSKLSGIELRKQVLVQKLEYLDKEDKWLAKYRVDRDEDQEMPLEQSVKYRHIPEEKYNSELVSKLYADEKDPDRNLLETGDTYQEDLLKDGFLDEKDPGEEDLAAGTKSFLKNSQAISKSLLTKMKFNLQGEHLVLTEIETANNDQENLLSDAVKYITETSRLRPDGKNNFWKSNIDKFSQVDPYDVDVPTYKDFFPPPLHPKIMHTETKTMTMQEVYSSIMLKKKLKNFVVEALREKMEFRKVIENKSQVQVDFIKFILDNFHGSGIQQFMVNKWLQEIPNFDSFHTEMLGVIKLYDDEALNKVIEEEEMEPIDLEKIKEEYKPWHGGQYTEEEYLEEFKDYEEFLGKDEDNSQESDDEAIGEEMDPLKTHFENPYILPEMEFERKLKGKAKEKFDEQQEAYQTAIQEIKEQVESGEKHMLESVQHFNEAIIADLEENQRLKDSPKEDLFTKDYNEIDDKSDLPEYLKPLKRYKNDVIHYIASCAASHRADLYQKVNRRNGPQGITMEDKQDKMFNSQRNRLVAKFYDNQAMEEFNSYRKLRELAEQTRKFKYDDVGRTLLEKARDPLLESTRPELLTDDVHLNTYQVKHPDDDIETFPHALTPFSKSVLTTNNYEMQQWADTEEDLTNYKINKKIFTELPKVDNLSLEMLSGLVTGDLYQERPSEHQPDHRVLDRAREWFANKYEFMPDLDDLSHRDHTELGIISYLFFMNKQKKITLGDIYTEMSRRRLNLDPKKFRGVGVHHIQEHRTKLRESFAKRDYALDLKGTERQFLDLFPPDKITNYELMSDPTYFQMIKTLIDLREMEDRNNIFEDKTYLERLKSGELDLKADEGDDVDFSDLEVILPEGHNMTPEELKAHKKELNQRIREEVQRQSAEKKENPEQNQPVDANGDPLLTKGVDSYGKNILETPENFNKEHIPQVCLEMELFNLIDLYFSMYGKSQKEDLERFKTRELSAEETSEILRQSKPMLRVDSEVGAFFKPGTPQQEDPVTHEILVPLEHFAREVSIEHSIFDMATKVTTEAQLESVAEKLTDEIIKVCPHVYPENFGSDPGLVKPEWSIQNQILRRFDDHVSTRSPVKMWRKAVELEFAFDDEGIPDEEDLKDAVKRPDSVKKADYDDAKEGLARRRVSKLFNEMQEDPFFESKLQEYFSSCHQMTVQNQYQKHFGFLDKPEEVLDRKNSPLVKNELVDFLMRYSDIRMQTRDQFYSSYAGVDVKQKQHQQQKKSELFNSIGPADYLECEAETPHQQILERSQQIKDFETRFFDSTRDQLQKQEPVFTKFPTPSPGYDLIDLEVRLNRLRDKEEFTGMHGIYKEHNLFSTTIPFALPNLDIRRSPEDWVLSKIEHFLDEIMNTRLSLERYLGKADLQKFDVELKRLLTRENIRDAVLKQLDQELTTADVLRRNYVKPQDFQAQTIHEISHFEDLQSSIAKKIKNPDALKRLYAYDAVRSRQTKTEAKFEPNKSREAHRMTIDMMMEEAMGADYEYLLWQKEHNDYQKTGSNAYMEKEGFRSKRYIGNEFTARFYGKTMFEYANAFNVYPNMGTTKDGIRGTYAAPETSDEFAPYEEFYSADPMQNAKVFENVIGGVGSVNQEHAVSKSLGWYFKKMNEELQGKY